MIVFVTLASENRRHVFYKYANITFRKHRLSEEGTKGRSDRVIIEARGSLYFTKKSIIPEKEEAKRKIRTCNNLILFPLKGSQTSASSLK